MPTIPLVLLVDDDSTTNFLHKKLLQRLDVTDDIRVALNGQEALRALQQLGQSPWADQSILVLLDINMPVMTGIQFLEVYAQLPAALRRAVVVVVVTSSVSPRDRERAQELPIADYLDKPLTQQQVERVVAQHFAT
ncbi:response regulator [Hymenobacter rigui]|uniref:Response regulator n=1 Tax=Hymenobacter rigui TaxID=334424 RepID=A0A428KM82_9BACT|nr:response regulator [Hymenobacter rigui]RSK47546.1 response regulator [Hymenobacter rigui]